MEPAISIRGLTKSYGNVRALDNFSVEVKGGEFFGFLGPNGAGKTTTINILAGLTTYEDGEVKVFGKDVVREYREARQLIGLVPQEFNFDDYFTVEEILRFYAGYFGMRRREARRRVDELLVQFDLALERKALTFSGHATSPESWVTFRFEQRTDPLRLAGIGLRACGGSH